VSERLPEHLVRLVDGRLLTRGQAAAIVAYLGDVDTVAQAEARKGKLRRDSNADLYWRQGADKAEQRVGRAEAAMGDSGKHVVHLVGRVGLSLAEAGETLGRTLDDVRVRLTWACDDLLRVYEECADAA
jgi:hypothetical protein